MPSGKAEGGAQLGEQSPRERFEAADLLLYAVTDDAWLQGRTLPDCVRQAVAGGATFVQLRAKKASHEQIVAMARELIPVCHAAGVLFVIDDDVAAAVESGADGVHVGQEDESCVAARAALGPEKIVGVSTQTVDQALAAQAAGADYLGVGTLIATPTKPESEVMSPETFSAICNAVDIPVVAIGGLNVHTLEQVRGLGAAGAAVVSAIFAADDCEAAARDLRAVCEQVFPESAAALSEQ